MSSLCIYSQDKEIPLNINKAFYLPTLALVLSGCGSDSGGDTPAESKADFSVGTAVITADNTLDTTSVVLSSVFNNLALASAEGFTGVVAEDNDKLELTVLDEQWLLDNLKRIPPVSDTFTGVVSSWVEECALNGNTTFTYDLASEDTISVNDSITFTSNNCNDGIFSMNGSFNVTYTDVEGLTDFDSFTKLGMSISFTDFTMTYNGLDEVISFNGSYSIVINKDDFTEDVVIVSPELAITAGEYNTSINNLTITKLYTENTNIETFSSSSTITDDFINGRVVVTTLEEFIFESQYATTPSSGAFKVVGANNTSVIITVLPGDTVQLDTDSDGDGTIDHTSETSWFSIAY